MAHAITRIGESKILTKKKVSQMTANRRPKCSHMNNTKWGAVLSILFAERIAPRIKLVYDDLQDENAPFGTILHGGCGPESIKPSEPIVQVTTTFWDSPNGPFRPVEIEWLAINQVDFDRIANQFPPNLKLIATQNEVIIVGYEF